MDPGRSRQRGCERVATGGLLRAAGAVLQELEAMKAEQEAKKLPPKYAGKWASANEAEVATELEKGTPHTFRFRVPENRVIKINDLVRGEVRHACDFCSPACAKSCLLPVLADSSAASRSRLSSSLFVHACLVEQVSWNTDTLGDFVVLRSNGQPVYNFCVAVDDASMAISHVVR